MAVQPKTIILNKFSGLDNVRPPEKSDFKSANGVVSYGLQELNNFFVSDDEQLFTRQGYALKVSCTPHSLWSNGEIILYREGSSLKRLWDDLTTVSILRSNLPGDSPMHYLSLPGVPEIVYYTDGISTGIIENGVNRTWGLEVPAAPNLLTTYGSLPAGKYQVVLTYTRNDGQESGASLASIIDVGADSGIVITLPESSDPTVTQVNIYVTGQNGEVLFYVASFPNGTEAVMNYRNLGHFGPALKTQFLSPPPPGNLLTHYNGRIYIVQGGVVWYTPLFEYEFVNPAEFDYISLGKNITMWLPVKDGIWASTDTETVFMAGDDVPFKKAHKDDSGAVLGTAKIVSWISLGKQNPYSGPGVIWGSTKYGFCTGLNEGIIQHLTEDKFLIPGTSVQGTGTIRKEADNSILYIASIYQ